MLTITLLASLSPSFLFFSHTPVVVFDVLMSFDDLDFVFFVAAVS